MQKLIGSDIIRPGEKVKVKRLKSIRGNASLASSKQRKKKRSLANTLPGLELSNLSHIDGIQSNRSNGGESVKLELLKEQASKDNRNRKFIAVGDEALVRKRFFTLTKSFLHF